MFGYMTITFWVKYSVKKSGDWLFLIFMPIKMTWSNFVKKVSESQAQYCYVHTLSKKVRFLPHHLLKMQNVHGFLPNAMCFFDAY